MAITNACAKEDIQQGGRPGLPRACGAGHGAGFDSAAKPIAHHHVITLAPFFDEARTSREIHSCRSASPITMKEPAIRQSRGAGLRHIHGRNVDDARSVRIAMS